MHAAMISPRRNASVGIGRSVQGIVGSPEADAYAAALEAEVALAPKPSIHFDLHCPELRHGAMRMRIIHA